MRKWKCVYTTNTKKYTFTVGKIYESDDKGYGIKRDDGFIFDFTTASLSESLTSGRGFVVTKFEEVFEEEIMKQYREVDREPVVGDMVKIVDPQEPCKSNGQNYDYETDDVLKIVEIDDDDEDEIWYYYSSDKGGKYIYRSEFVVVEEITQFGKSDLQECDIVVLRNGERYILFDRMFISNIRSNISLNKYAENLKYNASYMSNADIMQVNRNNQPIFSRVEPTERELQIKQLQDEMDKIKVKLEELR